MHYVISANPKKVMVSKTTPHKYKCGQYSQVLYNLPLPLCSASAIKIIEANWQLLRQNFMSKYAKLYNNVSILRMSSVILKKISIEWVVW